MVWALFILEPEICQQYFEVTEFDTQNKPLKIASAGYHEPLPELYIIGNLIPDHITDPNSLINSNGYVPFFTHEEISNIEEKALLDHETLLSMGYTELT